MSKYCNNPFENVINSSDVFAIVVGDACSGG